jgi:hypothetical protein
MLNIHKDLRSMSNLAIFYFYFYFYIFKSSQLKNVDKNFIKYNKYQNIFDAYDFFQVLERQNKCVLNFSRMFHMIGRVTSNFSLKNKSIKNIETIDLSNYKKKINQNYDEGNDEEELYNDTDDRSTFSSDNMQVSSLKCNCKKIGI